MTLVWGIFFLIWGVGGGCEGCWHFFKNIYLSHLNVCSCTAFFLTTVQLWQNSLHTAQALFCELYDLYVYQVHTYSVCSAHAVQVQYISSAEAAGAHCAFTQESATEPGLFTNTTFIHYFDCQIQKHSDNYFFLHSILIQSFTDLFKHNKYKKLILHCFLLLHLGF